MQTPKTWDECTSASQSDELMVTHTDSKTERISVENFHKSAPNADNTKRGYVTTEAQTFSGKKTFADGIKTDSIDTENGLAIDGNTSITGTMQTSGAASFGGNTSVTGDMSASGKLEGGSLETTGNAAIGGNAAVTGNVSAGGTLEATGKATMKDDLEVDGASVLKGDVSIEGNLNVAGVTTIDQQETATAQDYYIARLAASHGIAPGSAAGLAVVNYDGNGKMATMAVDKDGVWRVADSASNTATTYQNLCVFNGSWYSGLSQTAAQSYPQHIITNVNSLTLQNVVWSATESAYFHYDGEDWKEILSVTDSAFVFDTAVTDVSLIAALEALIKLTLIYYISVTDNAIDASQNQPLLTRAEEADLNDGDILEWDNTNKKAVGKAAGSVVTGGNFCIIAANTSITGPALVTGLNLKVMFTAAITGSNTTTGLSITYNSASKAVKVNKNGTLSAFTAMKFSGTPDVYKYLQANTVLELVYDGTDFVIVGNPVVLSGDDYIIYADGKVGDEAIGDVKPCFNSTPSYGWLSCCGNTNARTISRTEYSKLYTWANNNNLIGSGKLFGEGDGSTTFVLPDLREVGLKGIGETSLASDHVKSGGLAVGEFIEDRVQTVITNRLGNTDSPETLPSQAGTTAVAEGPYGYWVGNSKCEIKAYRSGVTTEVKAVGVVWVIKAM